jgi:hypothetical protein
MATRPTGDFLLSQFIQKVIKLIPILFYYV